MLNSCKYTFFLYFCLRNNLFIMKNYTNFLLRTYDDSNANSLNIFLKKAVDTYPFTLANTIRGILRELSLEHYYKAMNYTLDFFETASQYISIILFALLRKYSLETNTPNDTLIKIVKKIDEKRPLSFGDWCNDILYPLASDATKKIGDNKLVSSLTKVLIGKHNIYQGRKNEAGIIQIRNEYKGHGTTLSEEIYKGVVYTMEPQLMELIKALAPLGEALYFAKPISKRDVLAYNGTEIHPKEDYNIIENGHYHICYNGNLWLDLYPLVWCDENGFIYVFQSLINEQISYISTNECALRKVTDLLNEDFDTYMQKVSPGFDISDTLNWNEWIELMHSESSKFIQRLYNERRYNRELFVDRSSLSEEFKNFLNSTDLIYPLPGDAGQGKTNQLCYWTETLLQQRKGVIIFNGADFSTTTIENKIRTIFKVSARKPLDKVLNSLDKCALEKGEKITVFFDAINECLTYYGSENTETGPAELYKSIINLFNPNKYHSFKIVFTCRSFTWKNIIMPLSVSTHKGFYYIPRSSEQASVRGFSEEELQHAYNIYSDLYQTCTPYNSLSKGAKIRMRDPLVLKIACTNYLGCELPSATMEYGSLNLFSKMLKDIAFSYAGKRQVEILTEMTKYILDKYLSGIPIDSISFTELKLADRGSLLKLSKMILKDSGTTVAYEELLNKPERPVLKFTNNDKSGGKIQFIYERFLEYLMACLYYERLSETRSNIVDTIANAIIKGIQNEVFMGMMRNVVVMDYIQTGSTATIMRLATDFKDDYNVTSVVNDAVSTLVNENYEKELFSLIEDMIKFKANCSESQIEEFNALGKTIQDNKATDKTITRYRELSTTLSPVLRLKQLASATLLNGIFLTDFYNENVYIRDPFDLLWKMFEDPITEVRNDVCMYSYYISHKSHTLNWSLLQQNISQGIVSRMYAQITASSRLKMITIKSVRTRIINYLEIATRINVLLIIDALLSGDPIRRSSVPEMLNNTVEVIRYVTGNFRLVRLLMPFFSIVLRRQLTFQASYVNNVIEYQSFWDETIIARFSKRNEWGRNDLRNLMQSIFSYSRYYSKGKEIPDFNIFMPKVLSAYKIGDSFSYFAIERLLIINGICKAELIYPLIHAIDSQEYKQTQWYDYSQMSVIYVLYQLGLKMDEYPNYLADALGRWCIDWTRRCRGYFKSRNSYKANQMQLYKRNVMTWYAMVDTVQHKQGRVAPLFYDLIDEAVGNRDKELLVHLIENISELVTDSGYIDTALELLKYTLIKVDSPQMIKEFEERACLRYPATSIDLLSFVGKLLATAKNYAPKEVDNFLRKEITGLKFPGIEKFKDDILNYTPGGETLSDLFTHKFGNFLIWSLINEEAVDEFAYEAMCSSVDANNCVEWFDEVIKILFRHLFKINL